MLSRLQAHAATLLNLPWLFEIALLSIFINIVISYHTNPLSGTRWPELQGLQPLKMAQSQGPRTDACSESGKPPKVDEAKVSDRGY
jgi:hypothetical protein